MTLTLLAFAFAVALNPARVVAATPTVDRRGTAVVAAAATLALVAVFAAVSGPLLDALGVTGASGRIAAGIAMLAMAIKDIALAPPGPEPSLAGARAGLVPVAFPTMVTPAVAMLAVAGAADRGVVAALVAAVPGVALAAVAGAIAPRALGRRGAVATVGVVAAVGAALVTLDGVYAI